MVVMVQEGKATLVGSSLLVALGGDVMLLLVLLVAKSVDAGRDARADGGVAVLGNRLVGLLGSTSGGACRRKTCQLTDHRLRLLENQNLP